MGFPPSLSQTGGICVAITQAPIPTPSAAPTPEPTSRPMTARPTQSPTDAPASAPTAAPSAQCVEGASRDDESYCEYVSSIADCVNILQTAADCPCRCGHLTVPPSLAPTVLSAAPSTMPTSPPTGGPSPVPCIDGVSAADVAYCAYITAVADCGVDQAPQVASDCACRCSHLTAVPTAAPSPVYGSFDILIFDDFPRI